MEKWKQILTESEIPCFGVCSYAAIPKLIPCRAQNRLPAGSQSVIMCGFPYYTGEYPGRNVSRYAISDDYHNIAGQILKEICSQLKDCYPQHVFVYFTDASPIPEVQAARLAGLGIVGINGQLITKEFGSYLFLGEIVTTMALPVTKAESGGCLGCMQCVNSCPGNALSREGFIKEQCFSYITQKKGKLTVGEELGIKKGGLVWGCDICTDCCPMNRNIANTPIQRFYQNLVPTVKKEQLEQLVQQKAYGYKGPAILLRNINLLEDEEKQ